MEMNNDMVFETECAKEKISCGMSYLKLVSDVIKKEVEKENIIMIDHKGELIINDDIVKK